MTYGPSQPVIRLRARPGRGRYICLRITMMESRLHRAEYDPHRRPVGAILDSDVASRPGDKAGEGGQV